MSYVSTVSSCAWYFFLFYERNCFNFVKLKITTGEKKAVEVELGETKLKLEDSRKKQR